MEKDGSEDRNIKRPEILREIVDVAVGDSCHGGAVSVLKPPRVVHPCDVFHELRLPCRVVGAIDSWDVLETRVVARLETGHFGALALHPIREVTACGTGFEHGGS